MTLQSIWKRCATVLAAPLALMAGCATGPAPLTAAQQTQIATLQAQTAIAEYGALQAQLSGLKLEGLHRILEMRGGHLSTEQTKLLAAQIFQIISGANKQEQAAYKNFIQQEIDGIKNTDPLKAKQMQAVQDIVARLQREAEAEQRLADLATKKDAAIRSGDLTAARNHAIELLKEGGQIVNGKLMLSFSNQNPPRCLTHLSPEPTRPGELCYTGGIPIKEIDLAQLDPRQMNGNDIGRVPYIQGLFLKQHPTIKYDLFNSFRSVPVAAP